MQLSHFFEFAMLFTFGFSWPFAIVKTYRAKRVDGKSPLFMIIVLIGYLCGIVARLVDADDGNNWLCWVYLLDMALVSTDLTLYFYYLHKGEATSSSLQQSIKEKRRPRRFSKGIPNGN